MSEDEPDMGAHWFRKALEMINTHGLTLPFPMINRRLGNVVARALDAGITDPVVYDLVNRWKLRPPSPESVGRQWPWPVKLFTFGGLEMVEHATPLLTSSKPPRKLFELLLLLIAAKLPGIAKDQAAYRLWPDSEGDQCMQSLNTTLHRLRKLLSTDDAILLEHGRLLLNPRRCWVDCWHFEWLEQRAFSTGNHDTASRFLLEGLHLYRGEFVPEHTNLTVVAGYAESLRRSRQNMITKARALLENGHLSAERASALRGMLTGSTHSPLLADHC